MADNRVIAYFTRQDSNLCNVFLTVGSDGGNHLNIMWIEDFVSYVVHTVADLENVIKMEELPTENA